MAVRGGHMECGASSLTRPCSEPRKLSGRDDHLEFMNHIVDVAKARSLQAVAELSLGNYHDDHRRQ
jgi:hypothetical protein